MYSIFDTWFGEAFRSGSALNGRKCQTVEGKTRAIRYTHRTSIFRCVETFDTMYLVSNFDAEYFDIEIYRKFSIPGMIHRTLTSRYIENFDTIHRTSIVLGYSDIWRLSERYIELRYYIFRYIEKIDMMYRIIIFRCDTENFDKIHQNSIFL